MSLIQDALKRQQEESESNQVAPKVVPSRPPAIRQPTDSTASRPVPSVPDTMPVPPRPPATLGVALRAGPEPANQPLPQTSLANPPATLGVALRAGPMKSEQSGKSWKQIAGIIIFCILIVWGGGLLVILVLKQSSERALLGTIMPDLANARVTMGKPSVKAPLSPVHPPAAAMPKPVVTPAPARSSVPIPWISPAAATAPAFGDEREDGEDVTLPSVNKQELLVTVPSPVPVVWPRLKLSAVFSNVGSGQAGARLNNRLILLGDRIEGVTLVEIRQDSVVLKCGKETRSLKMGMTLN